MKELLLEYLSDINMKSLTFERADYKGQSGFEVVICLNDDFTTEHKFWFSAANRMGAEHMASVIKSYIRIDEERWSC